MNPSFCDIGPPNSKPSSSLGGGTRLGEGIGKGEFSKRLSESSSGRIVFADRPNVRKTNIMPSDQNDFQMKKELVVNCNLTFPSPHLHCDPCLLQEAPNHCEVL